MKTQELRTFGNNNMSRRIEKVNKNIMRIFGEILQKEADLPEDVMVTVTKVDTTHNLRSTKIWLSVWPKEKTGKVLGLLQKQLYELQGLLNRQLNTNPLPRVQLKNDNYAGLAS